ncbi:MAG: phosphate ABC transporter substrate-binding protein PstS [Symploca sp. SIO3C6]|uniref:Phosphate-binding protein n=1 Tax=Symploca sp. SIO1C4 TaxID=2607765 RepID=A0A6B3N7E5_9CYAN|nr:phosphate ABC transporter substrate-binding protein PstS [Symploca sp. SIO3C6]NER27520.1 phosphate ABC transporter substrate-binding protein PstS [Symploca sp. SIO1C4]NET03682.1 phosphate ABC transporter substrate-binding protein PstS [Symploca sp. SIO2B6]
MKTWKMHNWQRLIAATLTSTTIAFTTIAASAQSLRGGGASFPELLYKRYNQEYEQETGERFKYSTIGSGGGIRLFTNQVLDFGSTTLIPTPIEENQIEGGLLMVPTGGSALAIVYNLKDVTTDVRLSREQLVKIFTGQISNWKQVNSRYPDRKIQVVVRSDSSGSTFVLTKYLRKISDGEIAASREPNWGFDIFATRPQDSGVAGEVRRTDGAIGYVQVGVALQNNLPVARLENQSGRYVRPTLEETQKALSNIKFKEDFTSEEINDPEDGYPLVSLTWLLVNKKYLNPTILENTKDLLRWILTKGQTFNEEVGYTQIPEDIAKQVIETADQELRVIPY